MAAGADRRLVAGRYVLGASLGRGGMGTVWRADDPLLGRAVAVKEVELPAGPLGPARTLAEEGPVGAERAALRERALREARAAARLNHPGVVTVHDVVEADGRLFLVMELVEAPTLRELVDGGGPLGPAEAARVGLELLEALEAAHRAGIVHHDVKPANVIVPPSGRVKLADFGIASLQDDTQRTLTAVAGAVGGGADRAMTAAFGSLPYVAPEQASGARAGPAADLWALGATLWFAVEGAPPFERAGPAATLGAILHDPPGQPARAGPLAPVLLGLLTKDPQRRPPAAAVRRMLEPLAAGIPGPTAPLRGTARLPTDPAAPTEILADPAAPPRSRPPAWGAPPTGPVSGPGRARPAWGEPRPTRPSRSRPAASEPAAAPPGWAGRPGPEPGSATAWARPPPRRRRRLGRLLLVAASVLLLLVVASALGDGDRGAGQGPAGLRDPVRDGQFEFVVRSVECGVRAVGEGLGRREAMDQFCLVQMEVENIGREGRGFAAAHQYLFDTAGNRHDADWDATLRNGGRQLVSTHLNPGQRLAGALVYDLPDAVELARVELHDGPFSGGASVELG
jgi:eukaryotic-like serine/threonine-protein kinase